MDDVVRDLDVLLAERRRRERRRDVVRTAAWVGLAGLAVAGAARIALLRQEGITTARVRTCLAALSQTEGDVQTCEGQLTTHVRAEGECRTREGACDAALTSQREDARRCDADLGAKTAALATLGRQRKECDDAREQLKADKTGLEATLATRTDERDKGRADAALAQKEVADVKARLDACGTQLANALKAESSCEASRAQAESARIAAESDLAKSRSELAKSASDVVECKRAEGTLRADATHLRGELAQCEAQLAAAPPQKTPPRAPPKK